MSRVPDSFAPEVVDAFSARSRAPEDGDHVIDWVAAAVVTAPGLFGVPSVIWMLEPFWTIVAGDPVAPNATFEDT